MAASTSSVSDNNHTMTAADANPKAIEALGPAPSEPVLPPGTTAARLKWKIDLRLLPFVTVMYVFAFLDRINIGNARAFGLGSDLNLTGDRYNTALTIFFVPYVACEIPANLLMKRLNPRIWLPLCMFCFGVATVGTGLVQNYAGLLACRFLLGLFESSMFAGSFYLLGMWYTRNEAAMRFCFFFQSTSLAGAFGGLLASAIGKMDGLRGYHGWRWIFILEGTLTAVVALLFFFAFPPFPEEAKWLTEDERRYIQAHLAADQGASQRHSTVTFRDLLVLLVDPKVWFGWLAYFSLVITAYAFAFFAPTIIQTYGYSPIQTQLHSVPPWVATLGLSLSLAWLSDRLRHRFAFAAGPLLLSTAGFAILLVKSLYGKEGGESGLHVRYASLFLIAMGTYSAMPIVVCWFQMNLGGHKRRSMGSAFQIGFGNAGGFVATYTFIQTDAPLYRRGFAICIAFQIVSILACCAYGAAVLWANRKKRRLQAQTQVTEDEKDGLGDLSPTFMYMF